MELVELSQDIRRQRHERIREVQWERERLNERPVTRRLAIEEERFIERERVSERPAIRRPAVEEERFVEREVVYEGRRPNGRYVR